MPAFNAESPDLAAAGPLVEVTFTIVAAAQHIRREAGDPLPTPVQATAMIDTGASATAVKAGLLGPLGLHPINVAPVTTATGIDIPCPVYAVQLGLPANRIEITVIEAPLEGQHIQALIGRDVLQHGLFIYQGPSNQFTLSF